MILYGASGHGKVVYETLAGDVQHFFDDNEEITIFMGAETSKYNREILVEQEVVITIGDNTLRNKIAKKVRHSFGIVVAESAEISPSAQVGEGSQILQGAIVQAASIIGKHSIINTGASVDHDCKIGDFCHIAPQTTLCGNVTVGEGTLIGAGSVVVPGITIGKWCTIGAGTVVINDIPDYATVVGNPARVIKISNHKD